VPAAPPVGPDVCNKTAVQVSDYYAAVYINILRKPDTPDSKVLTYQTCLNMPKVSASAVNVNFTLTINADDPQFDGAWATYFGFVQSGGHRYWPDGPYRVIATLSGAGCDNYLTDAGLSMTCCPAKSPVAFAGCAENDAGKCLSWTGNDDKYCRTSGDLSLGELDHLPFGGWGMAYCTK
jgi:hypothetical protein